MRVTPYFTPGLHGLHSLQSAFWRDRWNMPLNYSGHRLWIKTVVVSCCHLLRELTRNRYLQSGRIVPLSLANTRHPARARAPLPLLHMFCDTTNLYKPLSRFAVSLAHFKPSDLRTKTKCRTLMPEAGERFWKDLLVYDVFPYPVPCPPVVKK